jgi:sec-independent protein translocase protein TatA
VPNVGPTELIVILVIALLVFGPKRLPDLGRSIGHGLREFKKARDEVTSAINIDAAELDPNTPPKPAQTAAEAPQSGAGDDAAGASASGATAAPTTGAATADDEDEVLQGEIVDEATGQRPNETA